MTLKTEDEARKCWCPFAGAGKRMVSSDLTRFRNCIASECMAWRWSHDETRIHMGYCGLAGTP